MLEFFTVVRLLIIINYLITNVGMIENTQINAMSLVKIVAMSIRRPSINVAAALSSNLQQKNFL